MSFTCLKYNNNTYSKINFKLINVENLSQIWIQIKNLYFINKCFYKEMKIILIHHNIIILLPIQKSRK